MEQLPDKSAQAKHPFPGAIPVAGWEWKLLALFCVLGAALRAWHVGRVPGLWYDEAINGLDALSILREGPRIFFDTNNHMREPLFLYMEAVGVWFAGPTTMAIRGVSTAIGILTIPVVWAMAREMKGPFVAAAAAAIFAFMRWHVHFSGLAFRTILAPLFMALAVLFLFRMARTGRKFDAAALGIVVGLGAYTYLSFRLAPFILLVGVVALWRRNVRDLLEVPVWRGAFLAAAVALAVFAPLGFNYLRNPEHFAGRSGEVSLMDRDYRWSLLARQARDVFLMPIARGDHVGKHNLPGPPSFWQSASADGVETAAAWEDEFAAAAGVGRPARDPHGTGAPLFGLVPALLFYAGLAVVLVSARLEPSDALLVAWLAIGSLASVLSFGAPNMLRLLILAPAVAVVLAEGALFVVEKLADIAGGVAVWLVVLFGTLFVWTEVRQLAAWPAHPMVAREFNAEWADVGEFLAAQPDRLPLRLAPEFGEPPTLTFLADGTELRPDPLPDHFWEFRTAPPFPPLRPAGREVDGGRSIMIRHPSGIDMGRLVEVER